MEAGFAYGCVVFSSGLLGSNRRHVSEQSSYELKVALHASFFVVRDKANSMMVSVSATALISAIVWLKTCTLKLFTFYNTFAKYLNAQSNTLLLSARARVSSSG